MKTACNLLFASLVVALGLAAPALAQTTISVIDLSTRQVTPFTACNEPSAVAWAPAAKATCNCDRDDDHDRDHDGRHHDKRALTKSHDRGDVDHHREHDDDDRCDCEREREEDDDDECAPKSVSKTAYAVCDADSSLVRIDLSTPIPTISAVYPLVNLGPSGLAIDPTGTRALVSGDPGYASYLDLTKTPFAELGPIVTPAASLSDVAFYGTAKGLLLAEETLYVVNLASSPPGALLATIALKSPGTAIVVDTARNRAVVSLDLGGAQVVDLSTNTLAGPEVGDSGDTMGVDIAPAGTPAIAVYESSSLSRDLTTSRAYPTAMVVDVNSPSSAPGIVPLAAPAGSPPGTNDLSAPSAVAFNPVSADALIAGDDGLAILKPPYTSVDSTIRYPAGSCGTTKRGIAASPDGTRALVVNEDNSGNCVAPAAVASVVRSAAVAPKHSDDDHRHHDKCEKRR